MKQGSDNLGKCHPGHYEKNKVKGFRGSDL